MVDQTSQQGLIVQVVFLAVVLIMVISIFISPRYKVHFFSLSFLLVFPSIGVYFIHPMIQEFNIDMFISGGII